MNGATVMCRRKAQDEEALGVQAPLCPFSGNSEKYWEVLWKVIVNRHETSRLISPYLKRDRRPLLASRKQKWRQKIQSVHHSSITFQKLGYLSFHLHIRLRRGNKMLRGIGAYDLVSAN